MLEYLAMSVVGVLSGSIGAYAIAKKMLSPSKILELADELLTETMENDALKQKLAALGAVLGAGIRYGVGIGGKGGKMKLEDLMVMGIQGFLQKYMQPQGQQAEQGLSLG